MKFNTLNALSCLLLTTALTLSPCQAAKPPSTKTPPAAKAGQKIRIAYLAQQQTPPAALSNLDEFISIKGELGAQLGIEDNNTTGKFTGQTFALDKFIIPSDGDVLATYASKVAANYQLVLLNLPADKLLSIADSKTAKPVLFFNVGAADDALRNEQCRANLLHILPNRAMLTDALAQFMLKKRWQKWFLVTGNAPEDALYTAAIKRAVKRFNMKVVAEKAWDSVDAAHKTEQAEIPTLTQTEEHDVLVVADEQGIFGEYLSYRTWLPRPVIGTQGLVATAWHKTHEQWGAIQMQNRFKAKSGRWMDAIDYAAYLGVRAIGEAASRTHASEIAALKAYLLSPSFALQGYKGTPLSFRPWDGQLRQPILLAADRSLVGVAPIEGFLHPKNELDTLGFDQPESKCQMNAGHLP